MVLKPGVRLRSSVSTVEVVVVRVAARDVEVVIGGAAMEIVSGGTPLAEGDAALAEADELPMGKRYADAAGTIEVMVTRAGRGQILVDGEPLVRRDAKPLPASD